MVWLVQETHFAVIILVIDIIEKPEALSCVYHLVYCDIVSGSDLSEAALSCDSVRDMLCSFKPAILESDNLYFRKCLTNSGVLNMFYLYFNSKAIGSASYYERCCRTSQML